MARTEIVYRDNNDVVQDKVFASFEEALPLISKLDRQNAHYEWYELRNGQWVDASEVSVMQDEDGDDVTAYLTGKVA